MTCDHINLEIGTASTSLESKAELKYFNTRITPATVDQSFTKAPDFAPCNIGFNANAKADGLCQHGK